MTGSLVVAALTLTLLVSCSVAIDGTRARQGTGTCCATLRYTVDPAFGPSEIGAVEDGIASWAIGTNGTACTIRDDVHYDVAILRASSRIEISGDDPTDWPIHVGFYNGREGHIWIVSPDLTSDGLADCASHEIGHAWGLSHGDPKSIMFWQLRPLIRQEGAAPRVTPEDADVFNQRWCR